ncbi:NTP pyrophosphohydrolase [Streptomyces sp. NPDC056144]|uniref:NTP pyrophosphohydrolase n=1 Tax=unclassified Streptomyces TaxID=2593676 RepID=UPI0035D6A79D
MNSVDPGSRPLLVVDGANVVGSVPDGWWRDRRGAAERLRDRLAVTGGPVDAPYPGPYEIVLVVEGRARGVASVPGVRVEEATGSGDDLIAELAELAARANARPCLVVTADRELRRRAEAAGARCVGPRSLPKPLPGPPAQEGS